MVGVRETAKKRMATKFGENNRNLFRCNPDYPLGLLCL